MFLTERKVSEFRLPIARIVPFLNSLITTFDFRMSLYPKIYVALPVLNEAILLDSCIKCIENQTYANFQAVVCVNQPEDWWDNEDKIEICRNNSITLLYLADLKKTNYTIIDKSSKGNGWIGNKKGVGWARKITMDHVAENAEPNDIIISIDADTTFSENYFASVVKQFSENRNVVALSNPYYHKRTGSDAEDRAILRYEIYMRNYAINLMHINSPYAFTALGSAIALPVSSYKAIGGLTPKLSGEDFYFLQKLRKYGRILVYNNEKVFPEARFSDRVLFGTGPAMIKGNTGDWNSYPVYHHSLFDKIKITFEGFEFLFKYELETPMSGFLKSQFATNELWKPLRDNFKNPENFIRACHEKVDGLRILQFLKLEQNQLLISDEQCLYENIVNCFSNYSPFANLHQLEHVDFGKCSIDLLDEIRNYLVSIESLLQEKQKLV